MSLQGNERHLSAQKEKAKKDSRFFGPPKDFLWPPSFSQTPPQTAQKAGRLTSCRVAGIWPFAQFLLFGKTTKIADRLYKSNSSRD